MTKDINNLIDTLSTELPDDSKFCCPGQRFLLWLIPSIAIIATFLYFADTRPDMPSKITDLTFMMDIALAVALSLTAGYNAFLLCLPDRAGKSWFTAVPITLLAVFTGWSIIKIIAAQNFVMPDFFLAHCIKNAGIVVIIPAALMVFITTRKKGITAPYLLMLMTLIAPAMLTYPALRITCMMDTTGHDILYHIAPFSVLGIILGLVARRLYRW